MKLAMLFPMMFLFICCYLVFQKIFLIDDCTVLEDVDEIIQKLIIFDFLDCTVEADGFVKVDGFTGGGASAGIVLFCSIVLYCCFVLTIQIYKKFLN